MLKPIALASTIFLFLASAVFAQTNVSNIVITKADIDNMAKKNIRPEKMNILLVGDKQKILEGVKKLGYPIIELDVDGKPKGATKAF